MKITIWQRAKNTCFDQDVVFFHGAEMGCSPSHAVIINQSPTQETICLQPKIYMVSESTLCLLQDVGELRVYHIDERNPETAIERFRGAQDQLQNPLLFHPQLRSARRERLNTTDDLPSAGSSSLASEQENVRFRMEVVRDEEQCDDVDEVHSDTSGKICDNDAMQTEAPESPNAHSVTVEVYCYKQNSGRLQEESEVKDNFDEVENNSEPPSVENAAALVAVIAAQQNQTSDEQGETREMNDEDVMARSDEAKDVTFAWSETADNKAKGLKESKANQNLETDQAVFTRIVSESGKETANQEIELSENIDD